MAERGDKEMVMAVLSVWSKQSPWESVVPSFNVVDVTHTQTLGQQLAITGTVAQTTDRKLLYSNR